MDMEAGEVQDDQYIRDWILARLSKRARAGWCTVMREFDISARQARRIAREVRNEVIYSARNPAATDQPEESQETLTGQGSMLSLGDREQLDQQQLCKMIMQNPPTGVGDMAAFLESMIGYQDQVLAQEREQEVVRVSIETDKPILLTIRGDWHVGSIFCDHRRWEEDNRLIESRSFIKTIEAGDLIDNAILAKMPTLMQEQIAPAKLQRMLLWHIFKERGHKDHCLAILTGQHTAWGKAQADFDAIEWLSHDCQVPFLGWGGVIFLTVGKQVWKIAVRHSYKFNSTMNPSHSPKQLLRLGPYGFADLAVVADKHTYTTEITELGGRATAILRPGSYKATDNFTKKHGFNPADYWMPGIILWPDRRVFLTSENFRKLIPVTDGIYKGTIDHTAPEFEVSKVKFVESDGSGDMND